MATAGNEPSLRGHLPVDALMRIRLAHVILAASAIAASLRATPSAAQPDESSPSTRAAFSLSSSRIATSRETPAIYLTYRRLDHLDFRVYRVNDPVTFLAGLKDPHQLGSEEPLVDQEPTTLERIADWKADWRYRIRSFFRAQFTHDYRQARRNSSIGRSSCCGAPSTSTRSPRCRCSTGRCW